MAKIGSILHEVEDVKIPIDIHAERRRNVRISFAKDRVILRYPHQMKSYHVEEQIDWAKQWTANALRSKPSLRSRFIKVVYNDGDEIKLYHKSYQLNIETTESNRSKGRVLGNKIHITVPSSLNDTEYAQVTRKLLQKLIAKDNKEYVKNRIRFWNESYFQSKINDVRLKYNSSNWGSCSTRGNINISTRILLAPQEVQDYIFIHELAHTKEMNHSQRFWKIVGDIMPDYKQKERWLKQFGHLCII